MLKISNISIGGLRRLRSIDLKMSPFTVLIGANGVGKTTFLDAFTILSASASGNLNSTLSSFGGITSLLTREKSVELFFVVQTEVQGYPPIEYTLRLAASGNGYRIINEKLIQQHPHHNRPFTHIDSQDNEIRYYEVEESRLLRPNWNHNPLETSLYQVPKMFHDPEEFRRTLASAVKYHALDVSPRAPVKLPQAMKPATLPGSSGEDLVSYLYYLRESDKDRFATIVDCLKAAFPSFEELNFPPVAAGMLAMTLKDSGFDKPFSMHELSEGTLRFLWLASLLTSPNLSTVTMIDEPEVSLHPEQLCLLADLMREASRRTQLIVSTHSDRFIRFLKPAEVVVMDMEETGEATLTRADSLDLDHWLEEYSLDEVWQMGRMGGRA